MTAVPLHLILLAGGAGLRARREDDQPPKQFTLVDGRPLLARPLAALAAARGVAAVVVVCAAPWRSLVTGTARALGVEPPLLAADPGPTRTASTWHALQVLAAHADPDPDHLVAVHDAARPFATADLLERVADAAARHGAAVPGVPVADTVVTVGGAGATGAATGVTYLDRDALRAVQTPQVARWELLYAAHAWAAEAGRSFTDDGGLLAARGTPPVLVPGDPDNWKVTTAADLALARRRLAGGTA